MLYRQPMHKTCVHNLFIYLLNNIHNYISFGKISETYLTIVKHDISYNTLSDCIHGMVYFQSTLS